jgi:hypothetical protein
VAKIAAKETPDLAGKVVLRSSARAYRSFRTITGSMLAEAQSQKDLLVKHGLSESVLDSLVQSLDEFDRVVNEGTDALRSHVGARAELDVLTNEVVDFVEVMDALNRFRFAENAAGLAEWETVSNVIGPPHSVEPKPEPPTSGGESKAA